MPLFEAGQKNCLANFYAKNFYILFVKIKGIIVAVIICEGLDRCGKSTQIAKLQDYFKEKGIESSVMHYAGVDVNNFGPFTNPAKEIASRTRYDDMLNMAAQHVDSSHVLIFDRAHLGEYVYSPLYRNYDGRYVFELEKKFSNLMENAFLFVFTDTAEHLISRDDGLSLTTDLEKKREEVKRFEKAFIFSNIKHKFHIDISNKSIDVVWNIIKQNLENQ